MQSDLPENDEVLHIESLLAALYSCLSGPAGKQRDWERLRKLHRPGWRGLRTVVESDGLIRAEEFDGIDAFIANAEPLFARADFYEIETDRRIERFGQIAHVWSRYDARSSPDSQVLLKRGANSIQLFNDGSRWWIISTIWDHERDGVQFDLW